MAAKIKIIPPDEWAIIQEILSDPGLILIPEENLAKFSPEDRATLTDMAEEMVDYNFGGESDIWLDIVRDRTSYAALHILGKNE